MRTKENGEFCRLIYGVPVLLLALSACMSAGQIQTPSLDSPNAALQARAQTLAEQKTLNEDALPAQWWQLFNDEQLSTLQAQAARSNLDLQTATLRIAESRAQLGLANAGRMPQLGANASYARSALSENSPMVKLGAPTQATDLWTLGAQASWELDLWGYHQQLSEAAQARLQASEFGMQSVKVSVAGEVARHYLLLRGVQAKEQISEQNKQIALDMLRLLESQARNGIATQSDLASVRADIAGIDARLAQQHQQSQALKNALAMLLGQPPRELDQSLRQAELPAMPKRLPIGVSSELARQRPDILQADAKLRAAVADIGAAKADFYPRISLIGGIGLQALDFADWGDGGSRFFSLGPTLHLPIFEGGRLQSKLALSETRQQLATIDYQKTVLRAWHEVDDALTAYVTEQKRHQQLQIAVTQNQTALHVAQRAYQEGTQSFVSVLLAQRAVLASQSELADCATAAALSVVSLYRALGGGWSAELNATQTGEPA